MGNSGSNDTGNPFYASEGGKDSEMTQLLQEFTFVSVYEDELFNRCSVIEHRQTKQLIITKEVICQTEQEMLKLYEEFERRKTNLTSPNLLRLRCRFESMQTLSRKKQKDSSRMSISSFYSLIMWSLISSRSIETELKRVKTLPTTRSTSSHAGHSEGMQPYRLKTSPTQKSDSPTSTSVCLQVCRCRR